MRRYVDISTTSPKGGKRGCLCPDGKTYHRDCCDGSLQAQGIGSLVGQGSAIIRNPPRAFQNGFSKGFS